MGVTGLWKLIEPCGKPVPVETLEGKILAVDISIWLHQVVKGFQDNKGSALPNAHLLGLFHRLCKLLYYRVKPVFVFDGCVPQLKRDTIARRQQQRSKLNTEAERIQALLLQSLAKEKVVQQALGANVEQLLKSPSKRPSVKANAREDNDDMFKLPELPASSKNVNNNEEKNESSECFDSSHGSYDDSYSTDESSSFDESNARHFYNANLQAIDVHSQHFKDLPADVRHEILVDIKETRKQSSWGRLHELPSRGDDFSVFQMKRLMKRRAVQQSLEEAEQEMGGKSLTYAELTNMFTEEGILEANVLEKGTKQIYSDEHTRFLLVRDLKKKLLKTEEKVSAEEKIKEETPAIQKKSIDTVTILEEEKQDKLGKEYDTELQIALAMSLENTQVYNESDYQYESNEHLKLNRAQRNRLQNAAIGPARAYMIEYGGMNEEEVEGIMEKSKMHSDCDISFEEGLKELEVENETSLTNNERISEEKSDQEEKAESKQNESESQEICLKMSDSDTDTDTDADFEEVVEESDLEDRRNELENGALKTEIEVVVDLKETIALEDDLFADIFETSSINETEISETKIEKPINVIEKNENISLQEDKEKLLNEVPIMPKNDQNHKESENETKKNITESILSSLKTQLDEVKNIKLDDIQIPSNFIEVSDDENSKNRIPFKSPEKPIKSEIIEICDSDDAMSGSIKPDNSLKTPQKSRSILEYYQADYVIKRTPDKPKEDETENVPKVKSPFYVNKTPKSRQKKESRQSPSPKNGISKASKTLFEKELNEQEDKQETEFEGIEPLKATPLNTEDLIKEAAQHLKDQKTDEELQEMASDLARERLMLESERNRQDRMGMTISERMNSECQELLKLFGIPYIVAPMEAEAQCAFLDSIELTNGTITDDSDIWLFGGRTVYKNFFAQNKHVLEFRAEKIKNNFNCDRKKLIQLACLVGSDYTTGVHGIGAVTALEILAAFTTNENKMDTFKTNEKNMRDIMMTTLQALSKFRDWWLTQKSSTSPQGSSARLALRKKLKNIELHDGFPSLAVVEAYLSPKVDESRDGFSWGYPDQESIREYTRKTFGWTTTKTNEILMPVLKRLNDKKLQATIRSYFTVKSAISPRDLKVSKRVQKAIDRMSGKIEVETPERPNKTKAKRTVRKKKVESATTNEDNDEECVVDVDEADEKICSNSTSTTEIVDAEEPTTSKNAIRKRIVSNLHNKKSELIPQREKDKTKLLEYKAKAAEIFKNAAKAECPTQKKKRKV